MIYNVLVQDQKQGEVLQCSGTGPEAGQCFTMFWNWTRSREMFHSVLVLDQKQGDVLQCSGTGPEAG